MITIKWPDLPRCMSAVAVLATVLLAGCTKTPTPDDYDRIGQLLRESIAVVNGLQVPGELAQDREIEPRQMPSIPDQLRALGKEDLSLARDTITAAQLAYERGEARESAVFSAIEVFNKPRPRLATALDRWIAEEPDAYAPWLARAVQRDALAWQARGGDFAHKTPEENFREMTRFHRLAAEDLRRSLEHSRRPIASIVSLMWVATASGYREAVRDLFMAGLRLSPRSYALHRGYLVQLFPKWGGSFELGEALLRDAQVRGLTAFDLGSLKLMMFQERNRERILSDPRAAIGVAAQYTKVHDSAQSWLWRGVAEREHGMLAEASESLRKAIEHAPEWPDAHEELAYLHKLRGNARDAVRVYEQAALLGSYYAQEQLSRAYLYGELGLAKDMITARKRCEEAAAMLNPWGEFCMGALYVDGLAGMPRDDVRAVYWFRRAAEQGDATAQHDLGWMLIQGRGAAADREQGLFWLRKAALQDHEYAKAKLEQLGEPLDTARGR